MKIMRCAVALTALAGIVAGCIEDTRSLDEHPVSFESSIGEPSSVTQNTRKTSSDWSDDDTIGVYMVAHGGSIADHSLNSNVVHRHVGSGNFASAPGGEIFYPRVGSVDFVAYHPWRADLDDHLYRVDLTDQTNPATIDLIYSNNATGHSAGDVPLLEFHHKLTKLVFNVADTTGASGEGLQAELTGVRTKAMFDLATGSLAMPDQNLDTISLMRVEDGDDDRTTTRLEAIVLPESPSAPAIDFALTDGTTATLPLTRADWRAGKIYIHNVTITAAGEAVSTGGSVIVDWDDQDRKPEDYRIVKTNPDDADSPGKTDDDASNRVKQYFIETFGNRALASSVKIDAYDGWDNPAPVKFGDTSGGAEVAVFGHLDAHLRFPPATDVDMEITGLPAGYRDMTLSYDIAADIPGVRANIVKVYADGQNETSHVTATIPSPNIYIRISLPVPSGTTRLRFVADRIDNPHGMRLDNIRLEGRK